MRNQLEYLRKHPSLSQLQELKARKHLEAFLLYDGQGLWQSAPHLRVLCEALEAVERGELKRLMVFMPPRHGKSMTCTERFPAWYLGRNPNNEIIITSYGADLIRKFSKEARDSFTRHAHLWGLRIDNTSHSRESWGVAGKRGICVAQGVGGALTGQGANIAIIDDPVKGWQEACSKVYRDAAWDWYRMTLLTRLAPGGAIVLIMTKWHEDDLAGRLLAQPITGNSIPWRIINFPALAEEEDILGRQPGDPLWPAQFPLAELLAKKDGLGSYPWDALYQQRPSKLEGQVFKQSWFKYFTEDNEYYILHEAESERKLLKSECIIFQTVDPAATEKQSSDYFAEGTWAVSPQSDLLCLDMFRERAETTNHIAIIKQGIARWNPSYVGVENASFGLNIIQEAKNTGLPIRPLKADTSKLSRALAVKTKYEVGKVYHRKNASWLMAFESELLDFPNGKFDDQVDVTSYAGIECRSEALGTPIAHSSVEVNYAELLRPKRGGFYNEKSDDSGPAILERHRGFFH